MKSTKLFFILSIFLFTSRIVWSQKITDSLHIKYELNHEDPVSLVNGMIHASKVKDLELIFLVFDPFSRPGGEMYRYMNVYKTKDEKLIQDLHDIKNSYVNGKAEISEDGKIAKVPMWYVSSVRTFQETIYLINRYGNWCISSF
ncbi:MAG: hypothetical protein EP338_10085 [Bacteroidetes bacterium]|nr:MAG: hypothetical protein EP338_10085 [Bacteroidota bacterium]